MNERPLPLFGPGFDPGPSFAELLRRTSPSDAGPAQAPGAQQASVDIPHGTTVVAIRFADGVVLAGDRRATSGFAIANRRIEKVFPADEYSGVAFAGVAGPGNEMVRANLPAALQGLIVVPLFAGFDERRGHGRVFSFDATGGKYEESDFQTNGSGGVHAKNWIKAQWREGMSADAAIDIAVRSLFAAADEDTATGGPDLVRRIFPTVAVISADGYRALPDDEVERRATALLGGPEEGAGE